MGCLSDDTILAFVQGRLDAEQIEAVDTHLETCSRCRIIVSEAAKAVFEEDHPEAGEPGERPGGAGLDPGTAVARYIIRGPVAAGGIGVVYRAHDPELDRDVAIKLVREPAAGAAGAAARARLIAEARAMAHLAHPNVARVYDAGPYGEQVYLAMELVDGGTLADRFPEARGWREVLDLFARAGQGLAAAHAAGIVHGDFKPENVLVGRDGRVLVTDFGLARRRTEENAARPAERPRGIAGTAIYLSPEQIRGAPPDEVSDQFSFCVALFLALYGRHPYSAETGPALTLLTLASRLSAGRLRVPANPGVPVELREVLLRGLSERREDRYASMDALLAALSAAAAHAAAPRWRRPRRLALATVGSVLVVAGVLLARPSAVCGDGRVEDDEECDDANGSDGDGCLTSCRRARCGDGKLRAHVEECDDGNLHDGDACSAGCLRCSGGDAAMYASSNGRCYSRHDRLETWQDARRACALLGADLITYNLPGEAQVVRASLAARGRFWIGLERTAQDFGWVTGVPHEAPRFWAAGEPATGACAFEEHGSSGPGSVWRTAACGDRMGFVCERPAWQIRPEDNHAYRTFSVPTDWDSARADCVARGADLVTIQDAEELFFLNHRIYLSVWTGGNDRRAEGQLEWITGEPFRFRNFSHRVTDDPARDADCVLMLAADRFWDDRDCQQQHAYICEVD